MIISARGEGRYSEPRGIDDGGGPEIGYAVADVLEEIEEEPEGGWTPENMLELSGVQVFKLVRLPSSEVLENPGVRKLLEEIAAQERRRRG